MGEQNAGETAVLGAIAAELAGEDAAQQPPAPPADTAVERGRYLAIAGNCATCHTAPGGAPLTGGLPFKTDFGTIYSTNITPDAESGIGGWTLEQFQRALRKGVSADGSRLYPAFPYPSFTNITDQDAADLYEYLMSVEPVSAETPKNDMRFPFNQRWLMTFWNTLFLDEGAYEADPDQSAEWNRGAYLVEGLQHCSACHTPRNALGAEKADLAYSGGVLVDRVPSGDYRTWSAPNLTSAENGLSHWSAEEIIAYLQTGKNSFVASFGPMNEVVMNSTVHLSDADLNAMAVYLKSLPGIETAEETAIDEHETGRGQTIYDLHCGVCHQPNGLGTPESGAQLVDSLIVQAEDPASLLNVIIYGPQLSDPRPPIGEWDQMPAFNDKIEDEEIAVLANFLRSQWGNKGGRVTVEQVAAQRPPYDADF